MSEVVEDFERKLDVSDPPDALLPADDVKELSNEETRDAWSLFSDKDPVSGLSYDWLDIRETLMGIDGVAKALPMIFDYYCKINQRMDPFLNYSLACSHFTAEELGDKVTRSSQKRLMQRVKKLIKSQEVRNPLEISRFHSVAE
jgi:hypothetical protein